MSKDKQSDCVKVIFKYADGTEQELSGKIADEWMKKINSTCQVAGIHRMNGMENFDHSQWKWTSTNTNEILK